jgi:hypothetical protein
VLLGVCWAVLRRHVRLGCLLHRRFPGFGTGGWPVGHSFAARGGMELCDRCGRAGSIKKGRPRRWGVRQTATRVRPLRDSSCRGGEAFDGAVAQRVVDALDQFPCRGDHADVAAAAFGDAVAVRADA